MFAIKDYVKSRLKESEIESLDEKWQEVLDSENLIENYIDDLMFFMKHVVLVHNDSILNKYSNIIFENGQGLLLDQNIKGYGEHTTPSNTGMKNALNILKESFLLYESDIEVCYVTRAYMTRHGAGRFDTECDMSEINSKMKDETNVPNEFQGTLRYGKVNVQELLGRISSDYKNVGKCSLAVTHLNETNRKFATVHELTSKEERLMIRQFDRMYFSDGYTRNSVRSFSC